jgi:peptide/nickel transport system substrate-binding protein
MRVDPRRWIGLGLIAVLALACGAAQQSPPAAAPEPAPGGTLVVATGADLGGVNELLSGTSSFTQSVLGLLFLQLLAEQPDFDQGPPSFAPALARSWEWSQDKTVLTLQLRDDVRWTDGTPVTAADVVWTWRAQTDTSIAWAAGHSKENIAAVEALDDFTVRVVFHRPSMTQLADLNRGVILPQAAWSSLPLTEWRENADWFLEHLVTNGPFTLARWDRQQQIVLERNELYHLPGRPLLDSVVFRVVPQKVNQVGSLRAGDVHFVDQLPAAEAATLAENPQLRVLSFWSRQYNFICWNTARPLFETAEIRRALTLAIDRQALVEALWFGHARIATSPIISSVWAHNEALEPWPYDPEQARTILRQHGWHDHDGDGYLDRNGEVFTFELLSNSNSAVRVDAVVMIQEQLRRAGIRAEVRTLEFNTVVDRALAHDFDAMLGGWTIDTSLDLDYAFHSDSIDGGNNLGSFSDPRVDALLDRIREQTEIREHARLLDEVQLLLHQLQPYTFLWESQRLTGTSATLRDARPNALDPFYGLETWWLEAPR